MKKNKGFTLVELLAVIVLIGLLMAIAVPSALTMSKKVKEKSYATKIDLINSAAKNYGNTNKAFVRKGQNADGSSTHYTCSFKFDDDGEVTSVVRNQYVGTFDENTKLPTDTYWCMQITIQDLVDSNDLNYDEKGLCAESNNGCHSDEEIERYDNVVLNPSTDYIINQCYVYVYYKYNRVYTYFDKNACSDCTNNRCETYGVGHEYRQLN